MHQCRVAGQSSPQEWCLASHVHPRDGSQGIEPAPAWMNFSCPGVNFGATIEKQFDEIQHRAAINARIDTMIEIQVAQVDCCPQRGTAPEVIRVHVCIVVDEEFGDSEMGV